MSKTRVQLMHAPKGTPHGFVRLDRDILSPTDARALAFTLMRAADLVDPDVEPVETELFEDGSGKFSHDRVVSWYGCACSHACPLADVFEAAGFSNRGGVPIPPPEPSNE